MSDRTVEIEELIPLKTDHVATMLRASNFKPMRHLAPDIGNGLDEFWISSIEDVLQKVGARGFVATRDGEVLGMALYSENPWESRMIGKAAGVISHFVVAQMASSRREIALQLLDRVLEHCRTCETRFLLAKAYTDDVAVIHAFELRGFLLMDTVVDCYFDFRKGAFENVARPLISADVVLRPAAPEDRVELISTAALAFQGHFGRFHADELIGSELATKIYQEWMSSSLDGYADWIDVAEISGRLAGFSVWKRPSKPENDLAVRVGHYSISGIHPAFHGRGLFTALTYQGMKRMADFADVVEGPTHINNRGVQAGYSKLQWRVCGDARHSFHKWIH